MQDPQGVGEQATASVTTATPSKRPPVPWPQAGAFVVWLCAVSAVLALEASGAFVFPGMRWPPLPSFMLMFGSVAGVIVAVAACAPRLPGKGLYLVLVPFVFWTWVGVIGEPAPGLGPSLVVTASLLLAGSIVGSVIGSGVIHAGHMLLAAYVTTIADAVSVLSEKGVSAAVVKSKPLLALLAISWPVPGYPDIAPVLGIGDIVMTTVYVTASRATGLSVRRTLLAMIVGYGAVFVGLWFTNRALPALPFLAVAFVVLQPSVWKLRQEDRRPALVGAAVITLAFAAMALR